MKELTYADIRKMALEHGIKDTRLHIGLWATDRYIKKRKMVQGKTQSTCRIINQNRNDFLVPNLSPS
jgi:hypothetical protein